jgi:branched-chain amino acid transport system permease protein
VVLGGLDSVVGAVAGCLIIGFSVFYSGLYLSGYTSGLGVGYQQVIPYLGMLGGLLVRPYGLYGTPEVRRV